MAAYAIANRNTNCAWCPSGRTLATHEATLTRRVPGRGGRHHDNGTAWPACGHHATELRRDPAWAVPFIPDTRSTP